MTLAGLALPTLLLAVFTQTVGHPPPPAVTYRVGPGDVLEVTVDGRPQLARLPTVQTTGVIWLPQLSDVRVEGLTVAEIETKVAERLARHELARPLVTVRVEEYRSQFVWVAGEVSKPGRQALRGRTRLLDALLQAGGFTARASGEVVIERHEGTFADGSTLRRFRFLRAGPTPGDLEGLETLVNRGDVVTAGSMVKARLLSWTR